MKIYVVTPHLNRLVETVLMRGHNICFHEEIWIIIPKLSLLPLLIWTTDGSDTQSNDSLLRTVQSPKKEGILKIIQFYFSYFSIKNMM